jgi:hypothetical protein
MNLEDIKLGERVIDRNNPPAFAGKVVGFGNWIHEDNLVTPIVLVQMNDGFYNPNANIYVGVLPVHPDSIRSE